jgi:hypothetical protein
MTVAAGQTRSPANTALTRAAAGGGYEFALAGDQMVLINDGSCEVSRLGAGCGTDGLTRVVDKGQVRKDRADRFFGRLAAWQNWIFTRPNGSGPDGALRRFGTGPKGDYDFRRV